VYLSKLPSAKALKRRAQRALSEAIAALEALARVDAEAAAAVAGGYPPYLDQQYELEMLANFYFYTALEVIDRIIENRRTLEAVGVVNGWLDEWQERYPAG
jgi:hypothetical protein